MVRGAWFECARVRLVSLIGEMDASVELLSEAIITLGSFAHGTCCGGCGTCL